MSSATFAGGGASHNSPLPRHASTALDSPLLEPLWFTGGQGVITWTRQARGFAAAAFLLVSQIIVSSAIASRMEASGLIFGGADQSICAADGGHTDRTDPRPAALHKTPCDICAFAAQSGLAPGQAVALLAGVRFATGKSGRRPVSPPTYQTHDPRLTRGPPSNA